MRTLALAGIVAGCQPADVVGIEGGIVEANGVLVTIPAGALSEDTEITVVADPDRAPGPGLTEVFAFEPHGLMFDVPVTVAFALDAGAQGSVKWSEDGDAWALVSTQVEGDDAVAEIDGFSWGYVADE